MTRNFLIILSVFLSCTLHLFADTSGYPIGFCNGQWNIRSDIKYSKRNANVSAALFIPQTLANTVAGNRVESLRLAIASTYNLETLDVWLRTSLNGPDLAVGHASADALSQGWNEVKLETPYNIPTDTKGFYIGYTYKQSHKCGLISALTTPHEEALWIQGPEEDWTDKSNTGTLCIEALVYGDKLPLYNLVLTQIIPDNYFIISKKEWSYTATVRNLATATVTSFEIQAEIEGAQTPCLSVVNCNIPLGSEQSFSVTVRPNIENALPANRTVNFKILSVNGNKDEDESDNVNSANISILEKAYIRNVFIEEFTTERCGNCPTAAGYFHEILQNPIYNNKVSMICHHSGYYTDWLTTDFDEDYMFLYNSDSSYAPAAMLDRTRYADTQSAVFFPENIEFIQECKC